jgi:hypothetical protein
MSVTTTHNEVRSVSLEPQTMHTPSYSVSGLVLSLVGGAANAAFNAGSALAATLHSLAQQARAEEVNHTALLAKQMRLQPVSARALQTEANNAASPGAALQHLLQLPLRIAAEAVPLMTTKLNAVVESGDQQAVIHLAGELAAQHQAVLQREATFILRESAIAAGLTDITVRASEGYLRAGLPGSTMEFRADVIIDNEGTVEVNTDTDGFHGTACEDMTAKIFTEAAKRGLRIQPGSRRSKVRISQQSRRGTLAPAIVRGRHR